MTPKQKSERIAKNRQLRQEKAEAYAQANRCKAFRRKYGVTLAEYEAQWNRQNCCCAICSRIPEADERAFAVDHCHRTGVVRGILCPQCNIDLGRIEKYLNNPSQVDQYLSTPPWPVSQSPPAATEAGTQLEHRQIAKACRDIFAAQFPTIAEAAFRD